MIMTTLKEIKEVPCECINIASFEKSEQFKNQLGNYIVIACSVGKYGINGKLIYSKTLDKYYKITKRCNALLVIE